jgi:hypothetical protein
MMHNDESFYDQLKTILLRNSTLRWISKEKDKVLTSEKIEAVNLSYSTVLLEFPKYMFLGDSAVDSIRARAQLSVAKKNAGNVMSWQQLFMLFSDKNATPATTRKEGNSWLLYPIYSSPSRDAVYGDQNNCNRP